MVIRYLFFLALFTTGLVVQGRDTVKLRDLVNGQTWTYTRASEELKSSRLSLFESLTVSIPVFTGLPDTLVQHRINNRIREVLLHQLESDSFSMHLMEDMQSRLKVYFDLNNKLFDQLGLYHGREFQFTPTLTGVDYNFLSCFGNIVTVGAVFGYRTQYQDYTFGENLRYTEVYYFDLKTGREYRPHQVFRTSSEKKLAEIIEQKVLDILSSVKVDYNEMYEYGAEDYLLYEYDEYGEEVEIHPDSNLYTGKRYLQNFKPLLDGYAYWKLFSLAYTFPEYSTPTRRTLGMNAEVRLSLDEIREHLNPAGPYGGLINYKLPVAGQPGGLNQPKLLSEAQFSHDEIALAEGVKLTAEPGIHTITWLREQPRLTNGVNDTVLIKWKEHFFDDAGKLIKIQVYEEGSTLHSVQLMEYENESLIRINSIIRGTLDQSVGYSYDSQGNLLSKKTVAADEPLRDIYYHYGDGFYLEEHYNNRGYSGSFSMFIRKVTVNNADNPVVVQTISDQYYYNELFHKYDSAGRIIATYQPDRPRDFKLYAYNDDGMLLSMEHDAGRYFTHYAYDQEGNLISATYYDSRRLTNSTSLEYASTVSNQKVLYKYRYGERHAVVLKYKFHDP